MTPPRLDAPTIVVVDDDQAVLSSLQFLLETEGFNVRTFDSGSALLAAGELPEPGCAVIDYHMPGMTGLDVASQLRKRHPHLPMVLITGRPDFDLTSRARALGVGCVVEKPLLENTLLDWVKHFAPVAH